MIYSMTAYARSERQENFGNLVCEMRSINHRYLEVSVFLPETLRNLEMPVRELIKKTIKRGKLECSVRLQTNVGSSGLLNVNQMLAQSLCKASEEIASYLKNPGAIVPSDILRFPGVLENKGLDPQVAQTEILNLLQATIDELVKARAREGEELQKLFLAKLDAMQAELIKVRERQPQVLQDQQERLFKRFADAKVELDPNRLEQEMLIFAQKIDVTEEMERLETHIGEMRRVLKHGGIIGRRLDFLLQELNREANTLGSKSVDPVLTHAAVEMKVLIEQIREQVQNIE